MNNPKHGWIQTAGEVSSIGMIILIASLIGGALGWFLDRKFHTYPYLTMILGFLGLASGIYESVKILIKVMHSDE